MALDVQVYADILGQPLLVLEQQGIGAVAGVLFGTVGAPVIVDLAPGNAQHQGMIGAGVAQQRSAGKALVDAAGAGGEATAAFVLLGEARLWRDQVDHPAHGAAAVQHRARTLDHLGAFQQTEIEHGGQRALRLAGIDPHAVDHQHHAFLLHAAQHRVLPPGAVAMHGEPRLAAEQAAGRRCRFGWLSLQHLDGLRNVLRCGLVALGGDDGFLQLQRSGEGGRAADGQAGQGEWVKAEYHRMAPG